MESEVLARKLASILAADVVGYSRLMGADKEVTLRDLSACREVIDGLVAANRGRVFGSAGDSVIAEIASPVNAVRWSRRRCGSTPAFRIGAGSPLGSPHMSPAATTTRPRR